MARGEWHTQRKKWGAGVGVEKHQGGFRGYVWFKGKKKRSRVFKSLDEATKMRDRMALKAYGELACLNWLDEDLTVEERRQRAEALNEYDIDHL